MSSNGSRLLIPERILEAPRNSAGSMLDTGHQYQIIKAKIEQVVQQKNRFSAYTVCVYNPIIGWYCISKDLDICRAPIDERLGEYSTVTGFFELENFDDW